MLIPKAGAEQPAFPEKYKPEEGVTEAEVLSCSQ